MALGQPSPSCCVVCRWSIFPHWQIASLFFVCLWKIVNHWQQWYCSQPVEAMCCQVVQELEWGVSGFSVKGFRGFGSELEVVYWIFWTSAIKARILTNWWLYFCNLSGVVLTPVPHLNLSNCYYLEGEIQFVLSDFINEIPRTSDELHFVHEHILVICDCQLSK